MWTSFGCMLVLNVECYIHEATNANFLLWHAKITMFLCLHVHNIRQKCKFLNDVPKCLYISLFSVCVKLWCGLHFVRLNNASCMSCWNEVMVFIWIVVSTRLVVEHIFLHQQAYRSLLLHRVVAIDMIIGHYNVNNMT